MKLGLCDWGVRTAWRTADDGEFFCPDCGGDRNYHRRTGRRRLIVLDVPLLRAAPVGPVDRMRGLPRPVRHARCSTTPPPPASPRCCATPCTPSRSPCSPRAAPAAAAAREAAVGAVRAAGFTDCTEDQLLGLLAAIVADEGRCTASQELRPPTPSRTPSTAAAVGCPSSCTRRWSRCAATSPRRAASGSCCRAPASPSPTAPTARPSATSWRRSAAACRCTPTTSSGCSRPPRRPRADGGRARSGPGHGGRARARTAPGKRRRRGTGPPARAGTPWDTPRGVAQVGRSSPE